MLGSASINIEFQMRDLKSGRPESRSGRSELSLRDLNEGLESLSWV